MNVWSRIHLIVMREFCGRMKIEERWKTYEFYVLNVENSLNDE